MTPTELRAEAERLLLHWVDLVQRTCSLTEATDALLDFATRHGKQERLRGRIVEAKESHVFAQQAGPEFSRWLRNRWADYQAQLAALERGEEEAG